MAKIQMIEPKFGQKIIDSAIELQNKYPRVEQRAPIGADIFVFIYPIFLITLYLHGMIKKNLEEKQGGLFILFSAIFSVLINILTQTFFVKERPINLLSGVELEETILHQFLPPSSFPSDHAAVSMSVAIATMIRGHKTKNKYLIGFSYFLIFIAIIMGICRVITIVHRPTDILGGFTIGIFVPLLLAQEPILKRLKKWIINPLIKFQERIYQPK